MSMLTFLKNTKSQKLQYALESFVEKLSNFDEIVEIYRLTGDTDYFVKVVAESIESYDRLNQQIIKEINFRSLKSNIVLKETGAKPEIPKSLKFLISNNEKYVELDKDLKDIKKYISEKI